jgi:hypothetical protein
MSQLLLPNPVYFAPGVPLWDTANSNDALNGTTLTVSGNGVIGGSLVVLSNSIVGGNITSSNNVTVNSNLSVLSTITCGLNLNVSNAITAGTVNTLNTILHTTTKSGDNITINNGVATALNSTIATFPFSTGATYMVSVPFGASLTSANFASPATTGDVKFFGCSATAFPIVASGNTPGLSVRCDSNNQSVFNTIQFVATAQASATEPVVIAGVPVGGLSNVITNLSIMPGGGTINAVNVTRIR